MQKRLNCESAMCAKWQMTSSGCSFIISMEHPERLSEGDTAPRQLSIARHRHFGLRFLNSISFHDGAMVSSYSPLATVANSHSFPSRLWSE